MLGVALVEVTGLNPRDRTVSVGDANLVHGARKIAMGTTIGFMSNMHRIIRCTPVMGKTMYLCVIHVPFGVCPIMDYCVVMP